MPQNPIEVREVTKKYGDFTAVDSISFTVRPGTIFGLLGPNGAGKTTTIRMIMNITIPDSGTITVMGNPSTEVASTHIGYLPEERGLYRKMKVIDHLVFLGEIRGVDRATARKRSDHWLERLELTSWRTKKVEELSKGMQQKLQFIGCVIHEPEILIMDEPFSGLDPVNARVLKDLFLEFKEKGRTLILSTHVMEQAEKLCDEIALINRSKVVLHGAIDEIRSRYSGNKLILKGHGDVEKLKSLNGVRSVLQKADNLEIDLDERIPRSEFLRAATSVYEVDSAVQHVASLDEVFVRVVNPGALSSDAVQGES